MTEAPDRPLLRQRNFLALIGGQFISISGERLTLAALYGLLLQHTGTFAERGQSSLVLWMLGMAQLTPVLLFSPFAGAWVDRRDLKKVMVFSDTLRALMVVLVPVGYLATRSVWPVNLLVFLLFTCNVLFLPAKSAITPEIVPPHQLLLANTLLAGAGIAGTVVAVLGGWVVDHWGWEPALYINGVTYLVSVVSLLLIRYRPAPHPEPREQVSAQGYLHEVVQGWRLVRNTPVLVLALLTLGAIWAGGGVAHVTATQHIALAAGAEAGTERMMALMAVVGIGSAAGIWWLNARGRAYPRHVVLAAGLALAAVGLACFAVSSRFAVFAGAALLVGVGAAPAFVLPETMLQEGAETRQRGRVFSARDFLMRLMLLGGQTLAGLATPLVGTGATLLGASALFGFVALGALRLGRRLPPATAPSRPA